MHRTRTRAKEDRTTPRTRLTVVLPSSESVTEYQMNERHPLSCGESFSLDILFYRYRLGKPQCPPNSTKTKLCEAGIERVNEPNLAS